MSCFETRDRWLARTAVACALALAAMLVGPATAHAQSFKKGSFEKSITTAGCPALCINQVQHGLGETPKALILWTNGKLLANDGSFTVSYTFGLGFTDGPGSSRAGSVASVDAGGNSNTSRLIASKALTIRTFTHTTAPLAEGNLQSWDDTNFTIEWSPNNNQAYVIHFIAIGGSDVSASVVDWQMPTATGEYYENRIGFRPDVVLHAHVGDSYTSNLGTSAQHAGFGLGVMTAAGDQWANAHFANDNANTADAERGQITNGCIYAIDSAGSTANVAPYTVAKQASFVSMEPDGFKVNFTTANGNAGQIFSLALKGVRAKAGSFNKSTATAPATDTISGVGLQPGVVLLNSVQSVAGAPVAHTRFGIGASDGTTEGSSAFQDQDGVGTTTTDGIDMTSKAFVKVDNNTPTVNAAADLTGLFDGSFTLSWTTNDSVATEIVYLALGPFKPFRFRKSITIDRTKVPSGCGTTLANFPMLYSVTDLDLRTTANGGDVTDAEGDDILFRALDDATCGGPGTAPCTLDHEIESYNGTSGQLVAWVRVPALNTASASSDTVIHIYYGNSDVTTSMQNADGVWDANYVGVWHLKEEAAGTGTLGLYKDSSGNGNHCDDLVSATGQTGKINGGHDFDGTDDRARASSSGSLTDLAPLTVSAWMRPDTFGGNTTQLIAKTTTNTNDPGYWRLELDNTAPEAAALAFAKDHGATDLDVNSGNNVVQLGVWQQVSVTWDGTSNLSGVRLYWNGSETAYGGRTSGGAAAVSDSGLSLAIGANGDGTTATDGLIDEVRISNIVRSVCWIGAEYNNTNAPGDIAAPNFYRVGVEVAEVLVQESEAKVLSGSYTGDGTDNRAINVGFVPDFVIVKGGNDATATQVAVFRTSTMSGDAAKESTGLTALVSNRIQSFDTANGGGFTVGSDPQVNRNGVMYYWTAFKAGPGKMAVGTYTGNANTSTPASTAGPSIGALGFSPDLVFIISATTDRAIHRSSASNETGAFDFFEGTAANTSSLTLSANGFTVGATPCPCDEDVRSNRSGTVYHWVAWNEVAGYLDVGSYQGNDSDDRNLTVLDFEPEYLIIKGQDTWYLAQQRSAAMAASTVEASTEFRALGIVTSRIQQLLPNGFQVSQQFHVNDGPIWFSYFAWKRTSYPFVISGSYTGNAPAAQAIIDVGFGPDVVIVKGNANETAVIKTSTMTGAFAKPMAGATALANNLITLDAAGFTVGATGTTDARVNADPTAYYWTAFKAAPSTMKVGTYVGTGVSSPANAITGLGFSPELVFVMAEDGNEAVHRSCAYTLTACASTETHTFDSTTGPANNWITSLDADGFTVATTSARTNALGVTYHYVAWNEIPGQMDVGSYIGNGVDNRSITGVGFEPEYVLVRRYGANSGGIFGTHHPASLGRSNDEVHWFHAAANTVPGNRIQKLLPDGFEVGNQVVVNELDDSLGGTLNAEYIYYAWKQSYVVSMTAVRLTAFSATRYDRGVLAQWRTGYEIDNLGFHLYREVAGQRTRVTRSLVAGSGLMAGQGMAINAEQRYAFWDLDGASADPTAVYWLEDVDFNGTSTWHGPVAPVEGGLEAPPDVAASTSLRELGRGSKRRGKRFLAEGARLERARKPGPRERAATEIETQWALAAQAAVKIGINRPGWYRVSQPDLVAAGLDPRVNPRTLRLFVEGVEQAMTVTGEADGRFDSADAVEFYGAGVDTPYTDTRTYWLVAGSRHGRRTTMTPAGGRPAQAIDAHSFAFTVQQKERSIYFAALRNGEDENWFGAFIYEEPTDLTFNVSNLDPAASGAELDVALQGVTSYADVDPDHQVGILVNGTEVGELRFDGRAKGVHTFAIPAGVLAEGANSVTVVSRGGEADYSLVDVVRLRYQHTYRADADLLRFAADGPGTIAIGGFASRAIRVVDITDPLGAEELRGTVEPDGSLWAVTVRVADGPRTLLAFTDATAAVPVFLAPNRPSRWHQATGADYVAVAHGEFAGAVAPLLARREEQGLASRLVDIEDVYDEFSFGEKDPQALRDFVRHARTTWTRAPRFLVLVGDATMDPRDYAGFGDADFVPTRQVPMAQVELETASDDWFADVDDDGLSEVAVGRLSVRTRAQADRMVAKILEYEDNADVAWTRDVLIVADKNDGASDFERSADALGRLVPADYTARRVLSGRIGAEVARLQVVDAVNQGQLIVNYIGHGSVRVWGTEGTLLTPADVVDAWRNRARLPLVVAMNCLNGFFHGIYDEESLAETLLRAPDGGAVAAWASSGLTESATQARLNRELFRLLFGQPGLTVGEAVAIAKRAVTDRDLRRSWVYFGDPALRLKGAAGSSEPPMTQHPQIDPVVGVAADSPEATSEPAASEAPELRFDASATASRLVDFSGDGRADFLLYHAATGRWSALLSDGSSTDGEWPAEWQAVAADFNGDRLFDVVLYDARSGAWLQGLNEGGANFRYRTGTWLPDGQVHLGDLNGDGREDVLVADRATGRWTAAVAGEDGAFTSQDGRGLPAGELRLANFIGDRRAELFAYDAATGRWALGVYTGATFGFTHGTWTAASTARLAYFNRDARADLVLVNPETGDWNQYFGGETEFSTVKSGHSSEGMLPLALADLTGDGRDDLLLGHPVTRQWFATTTTSPEVLASHAGLLAAGSKVAAGDVDGDGRPDLFFYDGPGETWLLAYPRATGQFVYTAGPWSGEWAVVGQSYASSVGR